MDERFGYYNVRVFALTSVYSSCDYIHHDNRTVGTPWVCQDMPALNNVPESCNACLMGAKQRESSLNAIQNHCFGEGSNALGEM